MDSEELKLSIIVPVYNVEQYIRPCMESIFRQGLDDSEFELILVNDGTQDNSFGIISDIIESHHNIRILEQENSGPSVARNNGIKNARGQYLMFVDSDDLLINNSLAKLLDLAIEKSVDLLVSDFFRLTDKQITDGNYNCYPGNVITEKTGYELYLEDLDPHECYVWRILFRRLFILEKNISFIMHNYCFEDIPFVQECYLFANKCVKVDSTTYIYRIGHASITSFMTIAKLMDLNVSFARLWELQHLLGIPRVVMRKLQDNNFASLSFELWCISHNDSLLHDWKLIVDDLKKRIPNLWFNHGLKQIFVSSMFWFAPSLYLKIRSLLTKNSDYFK